MAPDPSPTLSSTGRPLLADQPPSSRQLRAATAERFPHLHAAALTYACRCLLPPVQVPPCGVWGKKLQVASTPLDSWLGRPLHADASLDGAVLRYLAAFGPVTRPTSPPGRG